jgi:hypothetical protein
LTLALQRARLTEAAPKIEEILSWNLAAGPVF